MNKYVVGQKVRIINNTTNGFEIGQIVEIKRLPPEGGKQYFLTGTVRNGWNPTGQYVSESDFTAIHGFNLSQPVFTAEGTPVVVVTTQGRDPKYPVLAYEGKAKTLSKFTIDGKSKTGVARRHLTNVQATPETPREFFVNLYDGDADISYGEPDVGGSMYGSIEAATNSYNQGRSTDKTYPKRVGIAKLVLVEGRLPKNVLKAIDKEGK